MRGKSFRNPLRWALAALAVVVATTAFVGAALSATPVSGAIFTTDVACNGTNVNIFGSKDAVYLDGGPAHPGAAGLPDGSYYVQVTEPNGTLLGTSVGAANQTPAVVSGGEFATCYQLSAILIKASDSTAGYDTTTNGGGEYKVWVSQDPTFPGSATKTDNFKVNEIPVDCNPETDPNHCTTPPESTLNVVKFYDANANGINDDGQLITGWKVNIHDGINFDRFTPVSIIVAPDDYVVTEYDPLQTNWLHTTANPVNVSLANGDEKTVEFGNVCLGAGGGLTLGYWSNKNGEKTMNDGGTLAPELTLLSGLNLRNANGTNFDPATYAAFRTWILGATATNMANMLSAQLAAMELNVEAGNVSGSALVYVGGSIGFTTINNLMTLANTSLGTDGNTVAAGATRTYQELLKNALDKANNNLNFVQATPCAFSFAP
jgi:hypothetical protein